MATSIRKSRNSQDRNKFGNIRVVCIIDPVMTVPGTASQVPKHIGHFISSPKKLLLDKIQSRIFSNILVFVIIRFPVPNAHPATIKAGKFSKSTRMMKVPPIFPGEFLASPLPIGLQRLLLCSCLQIRRLIKDLILQSLLGPALPPQSSPQFP